jgi:hypothetical protein
MATAATNVRPNALLTSRWATVFDDLSKLDGEMPEEAIFERALCGAISATSASGGAVWKQSKPGVVKLLCQADAPALLIGREESSVQHAQLVGWVLNTGRRLVAPPSQKSDIGINPTNQWLLLAPVKAGLAVTHIVELFHRIEATEGFDRSTLEAMERFTLVVSELVQRTQLRSLAARQLLWERLDAFSDTVHSSLVSSEVAAAIANDGRRLLECDRLSVAIKRHGVFRIVAISGQAMFDRRSETIRALNDLVDAAAAADEPFWYCGATSTLAPQLSEVVEAYVERSHSKRIGILPLRKAPDGPPDDGAVCPKDVSAFAALVIEQFDEEAAPTGLEQRAEYVCRHAARALSNTTEHESLFLLPVWRTLGKSKALVTARHAPKTGLVAAAIFAVGVILALVPYDFEVHALGTLQPIMRREVFAGQDGVVDKVLVRHGQQVERGQLLAQLRDTDLEVTITETTGKRAAAVEQLSAIERSLIEEGRRLSPEERNRLSGDRRELVQQVGSLTSQLELLHYKRERLKVVSPLSGEVTTWNVEEILDQRPVERGQALLNVADTSNDWELELRVPESQMGYVCQAREGDSPLLPVTYRLATEPGVDRLGSVRDVHMTAEVRGEEGNTVLVGVAIDKGEITHLQLGAECRAKVYCGRRALGFVLFHDVVAFVQSRILFRL